MVSHDHALGECRSNNVTVDDTSVKVVFFIKTKVDTAPHLRMVLDPLNQRLHGLFPSGGIPVGTILELHLEESTLELAAGVLGIGARNKSNVLSKVERVIVLAEMQLLLKHSKRHWHKKETSCGRTRPKNTSRPNS